MISRREMIGCTCGCLAVAAAGFVATSAAAATDASSVTAILPSEIGGVRVPDTALAKSVVTLVREAYPDPIFNHVTRSFVFGSKLGQARNMKYDEELLFVAAMMHDLGLTERYMAEARFELDGADAAAKILRERNFPESKIDIVWEAIALHASREIPERRRPEVALVHLGTFMDGSGMNAKQLPSPFFDSVFEVLPQLQNKAHLTEAFARVLKKKPHTAYHAFLKDIAVRMVPGFNPPNFCDIEPPAPFNR